jgi:hypothetical protein
MSMLLAYRQTTQLLGHELWVAQRTDGNWLVWIEGRRSLQHEPAVKNEEEAKKVAHSLAHWHIEGKHFCDCSRELRWKSLQAIAGDSPGERRKARRMDYICEIRCQDKGMLRLGRIANLSTDGAFIQTTSPSFKGSVLNLTFQVGRVQIETLGEVIHQKPQHGMGVRFLNLQPGYRALIADLVNRDRI